MQCWVPQDGGCDRQGWKHGLIEIGGKRRAVIISFRVYLFIGHFVRKSTYWNFLLSYSWRFDESAMFARNRGSKYG